MSEGLQLNTWDWGQRVATEGLRLNGSHWRIETDRLQLKGFNQRLWTEDSGLNCCDWRLPTASEWSIGAQWLLTKGCNRRVATEVLQRKTWDWRLKLGIEGLGLKCYNWRIPTECLWRKGWEPAFLPPIQRESTNLSQQHPSKNWYHVKSPLLFEKLVEGSTPSPSRNRRKGRGGRTLW